MSKIPTFSIVIPVYNAEKTIRRCLDSIKQQSFSEYEVILINDGSTDASEKLISPYLADKRFLYHWQANQGSNEAYNRAISLAKGKYIISLDDDDAISSGALFSINEIIRSRNPDIIQFQQCVGLEAIQQYEQKWFSNEHKQPTFEIVSRGFGKVNLHTHSGKAIRRALFLRVPHPLFAGDPVGADSRLINRLFWISRQVVFSPNVAWFHYETPFSQSRKPISDQQYLQRLHSWIEEEAKAIPFYEENKNQLSAIPDLWDIFVLYLHMQVKHRSLQRKETARFAKLFRRHKQIIMQRITWSRRFFLRFPFISTKFLLWHAKFFG